MDILYFTDIHIKHSNYESIDALQKILDTYTPGQFEHAVIAGDTLDSHEHVDSQLLNKALSIVRSTRRAVTGNVYIIVGNHDYINNKQFCSHEHWLNVLKEWPRIVVVDKVTWIVEGRMMCVPYVYPGRFSEALADNRVEGTIFCHQEFKGCKLGCITSMDGDEHPTTTTVVDIISGHIHEKHRIGGSIYYPGNKSVFEFTFDETTYRLLTERELKYVVEKEPAIVVLAETFLTKDFVPIAGRRYRVESATPDQLGTIRKKNSRYGSSVKINMQTGCKTQTSYLAFDEILRKLLSESSNDIRKDFETNVNFV